MYCAFGGALWPLRDYISGRHNQALRYAMAEARDWMEDNHLFLYARGDRDPDLDPEEMIDYEAAEVAMWQRGVERGKKMRGNINRQIST